MNRSASTGGTTLIAAVQSKMLSSVVEIAERKAIQREHNRTSWGKKIEKAIALSASVETRCRVGKADYKIDMATARRALSFVREIGKVELNDLISQSEKGSLFLTINAMQWGDRALRRRGYVRIYPRGHAVIRKLAAIAKELRSSQCPS